MQTKATSREIWRTGDAWRRLECDLYVAGTATVLTRNGSVRLLDLRRHRQVRIPAEHHMLGDHQWHDLSGLEATPCGIHTTTSDGRWHITTRIHLLVAGLDADLAATIEGRAALTDDWSAPDHGPDRCVTPYCVHQGSVEPPPM